MPIVPLVDRLSAEEPDTTLRWKTDPDDTLWRQMVIDHIPYIKATASPLTVSPQVSSLTRYGTKRLWTYLKQSHQYLWVAELINDHIDSISLSPQDEDLLLLIPDPNYMKNLYDRYQASGVATDPATIT